MALFSNDLHFAYLEVYRHFHPASQQYAGADHLVTALSNGWEISQTCYRETHWHAGMRGVDIFHVELVRGDEQMQMAILSNPYMRRMIRFMQIAVLPIEERDPLRRRQKNADS